MGAQTEMAMKRREQRKHKIPIKVTAQQQINSFPRLRQPSIQSPKTSAVRLASMTLCEKNQTEMAMKRREQRKHKIPIKVTAQQQINSFPRLRQPSIQSPKTSVVRLDSMTLCEKAQTEMAMKRREQRKHKIPIKVTAQQQINSFPRLRQPSIQS